MHYRFGRAVAGGSADSAEAPREFWIDVGGTFTDCVAPQPDGSVRRFKLLSTGAVRGATFAGSSSTRIIDPRRAGDPDGFWSGWRLRLLDRHGQPAAEARVAASAGMTLKLADALPGQLRDEQPYELVGPDEAPLVAVRYLLGLPGDAPLPRVVLRLGTTRGTNALLTRSGARTAWVTTRGFRDAPRIGYQSRPRLFELAIRKPPPLHAVALELDERVSAAGELIDRLDDDAVRAALEQLRKDGVEALAICLLHGARYPEHERRVAAIAREFEFRAVRASHGVSPLAKLVARGDTTLVDAYLTPVLGEYIQRLTERLGPAELWAMTSAGNLVAAERFSGKDCVLSGPAGGVVGLARVGEAAGAPRVIGFDMGGTSTDVSRYEGRFEREFETEKAGVRICAPMLAIETVAAGGGSICRFDGVKLVVGPESAGADPGPACYGRGGPLTVTDVNLFLGRMWPQRFPFDLDLAAVERRLRELNESVAAAGARYTLEELAEGLSRVANSTMAGAVRSVSIARGYDPRQYTLVPFGGAAGQHACAVARELGMRSVLCHADAGLLSALGVGLADRAAHRAAPVYAPYRDAAVAELEPTFAALETEARDQLQTEGGLLDAVEVHRALELRYRGVEAPLLVEQPSAGTYAEAFASEHRRRYGFEFAGRELEIVTARVEVVARRERPPQPALMSDSGPPLPSQQGAAWFGGREQGIPVFERDELRAGQRFAGPALVVESASTTIVDPGWRGEILPGGELLLTDTGTDAPAAVDPTVADPILLEVFHQHFAAIAREMGHTLRHTSISVNIKERLDFSCALFTADGDLVVNAPHIPVHLGAMSETVRAIRADNPQIRAGDVFLTNDPYRGGSHLPDVTVVTPVVDAEGAIQFFVASRAHHAEIGGTAPGSMPAFSRTLAEEGVLLRNFRLVDGGQPRFDALEAQLRNGPFPSRAVADNLADVAAQVAANQQGVRDLQALVARHGWSTVSAYMRHIQQAAERKTRTALAQLRAGRYAQVDHLDDGTPIAVVVTLAGGEAVVDFSGSGRSLGNFNAPAAIVRAAVMYVLRLLLGEDVPLNEGVLAPVRIVTPEGVLNPRAGRDAAHSPAVAAGNVETSQRVVDVLLGALGLAAASQGTMNNLLVGDQEFGYYETICGGSGATCDHDGADAVQTHMTNTRLTDPEVLESRYPIRVREFSIREDSGGPGRQRGGHGARRVLEFLRPLTVSLVTSRRGPYAPFGMEGGQPGARGRNRLVRADGREEELSGCARVDVAPGDRLILETPGGGGWGRTRGENV